MHTNHWYPEGTIADMREELRNEEPIRLTAADIARLDAWALANGIPLEPPF